MSYYSSAETWVFLSTTLYLLMWGASCWWYIGKCISRRRGRSSSSLSLSLSQAIYEPLFHLPVTMGYCLSHAAPLQVQRGTVCCCKVHSSIWHPLLSAKYKHVPATLFSCLITHCCSRERAWVGLKGAK